MSILDRIEEAVDEWPNMVDPCEECVYGDNRRCWNVCGECCFYYPSKFKHKRKGDKGEQTAQLSGDEDKV